MVGTGHGTRRNAASSWLSDGRRLCLVLVADKRFRGGKAPCGVLALSFLDGEEAQD